VFTIYKKADEKEKRGGVQEFKAEKQSGFSSIKYVHFGEIRKPNLGWIYLTVNI
jgi:hypothetical protein